MAGASGSVVTSGVAPWNPQKSTAPPPPASVGNLGNVASRVTRISASTSGNVSTPDVALDSENVINPVFSADNGNGGANPSGHVTDIVDSVAPDYPLDSLPRHSSSRNTQAGSGNNRTSSTSNSQSVNQSRPGQRRSENVSASRPGQRNVTAPVVSTVLTVSRTHVSTTSVSVPPIQSVSTMSPRGVGDIAVPPHLHTGLHAIPPQAGVSHSAVSVSVNRSYPTNADGRPIRTQDLNIGVSRLDGQRHASGGPGALPDLLAHSQVLRHPPAHGAPTQTSSRTQAPADPRISSSGHRVSESHSRHRQSHGDHERSRHRSRRRSRRHEPPSPEEPCKVSCYRCIAVTTSFRWILVILSLLGVCCVVTGIVLAALHAAGNSFLFLAIMFIGLGVLLVVVVGVGWKCTPRGHEPLHALFGLGDFRRQHGERRRRRHHRRDGRWHGGVTYPEFQYRRPPPTYTASMQEFQHQLMTAPPPATGDTYDPDNLPDEDYSLPSSPPPSYRSRASTVRAGVHITFPPNQGGDLPDSRPPTYRSHPGSTLQSHTHLRPSLPRDDDDDHDRAPEDIAFTSDSVFVDASTNQNGTSIQIGPTGAATQNVTVSVTTVSVTAQSAGEELPQHVPVAMVTTNDGADAIVDPVGDIEGDRVQTAL